MVKFRFTVRDPEGFPVLSLSIKAGQEVEMMLEGENEQEEALRLEAFVRDHTGA